MTHVETPAATDARGRNDVKCVIARRLKAAPVGNPGAIRSASLLRKSSWTKGDRPLWRLADNALFKSCAKAALQNKTVRSVTCERQTLRNGPLFMPFRKAAA